MKYNKKNGWDVAGLVFGIVFIVISAFCFYLWHIEYGITGSYEFRPHALQHVQLHELNLLIASQFWFAIGVLTTIHYGKQLSKEKEAK